MRGRYRCAGRRRRWPAAAVVCVFAAACSGGTDDGSGGGATVDSASTLADDVPESTSVVATERTSTTAPEVATSATTSSTVSISSTVTTASTAPQASVVNDVEGVEVIVSGPVAGDPASAAVQDLAAEGYVEEEFVLSGTARSYTGGAPPPDGVWDAELADQAPYRTRLLVRRPADEADFSGVVVVEWFNVSSGVDIDPDWSYLHRELLREGHAHVAVSAQSRGVEALLEREDGRYADLRHPGDAFAYDMFSQAGLVVGGLGSAPVLGPLDAATVIAIGQSQSAFFLTTYVNAVLPRTQELFDGVVIHSRGDFATGLDPAAERSDTAVLIRTDLDAPVFTFQTETDVGPRLRSARIRQPDTDRLRLWEVAGTAHTDAHILEGQYGLTPDLIESLFGCTEPVNEGQQAEVLAAAFRHMVVWVEEGTPPPVAPYLDTTTEDPPDLVRDADGIVTGGIRTPAVDVPTAVLSGYGQDGGGFCGLFGTTVPFEDEELAARYGTPDEYVARVTESARNLEREGFLLAPEVDAIIAEAGRVSF